ncbi:MAG: class A beta-lactamase-related serine hydrolase [Candidatus Marinimicrobia bacterium]|nr:class A beta-lactamase-related serine hydrolase [Candidatus Neomarinimicrobiota bacterium]
MKRSLTIIILITGIAFGQSAVPSDLKIDDLLSVQLREIVVDLGLDKDFDVGEDGIEQISLAVIDLNGQEPRLGGVNPDNFIYPASVYKMYVAAEVLNQISQGKFKLTMPVVADSPNIVDRSKEILHDPRPLLVEGDTVTVGYLLDLMITRSDNSAANCLIDLARRENINELIHLYGWQGSEVTRKFLKRKYEDPGYEKIRGTETCARHAAEFMYRIETDQLVDPWVSKQMKSYLGRQLDIRKLAAGLPDSAMFYHKTGWFSYWTNDVGIVDDGKVRYVIACFVPVEEDSVSEKYKELSIRIFDLMNQRKGR